MLSAPSMRETVSSPTTSEQPQQLCRRFQLAEIQSATQNFYNTFIIGRGGFGKVYKGLINCEGEDEQWCKVAAIKRFDSSSKQGANEFWAEIDMLSRLSHSNLLSLVGYCDDDGEMILVYDYMPNGSLEDHLHKVSNGCSLPWLQRLKICIGAANGLNYLHTGTGIQQGIIHRDVKSSNIMLDENWEAKVSDFGLSKIGSQTNQASTYVYTSVKGTFGYLDPAYYSTGRLTKKSDVYAFGVILFEVLCGRRAVDTSLDEEQWGLARWAQDCVNEGKLGLICDPSLNGQISSKCLKEFANVAYRCLLPYPRQRPTMADIVVCLESALAIQRRIDISIQPEGTVSFPRRMQNLFLASFGVNSVSSTKKISNANKGILQNWLRNNDLSLNKDGDIIQKVFPVQTSQSVMKCFKFSELKKATKDFSQDMRLGQGVSELFS